MAQVMRAVATTGAPSVPALLAWPAGLPWPAVFALAVLGLSSAAGLAWARLLNHRVEETHRHQETMTALARSDMTPDIAAVVAVLRSSNEGRSRI